jgi:hypothetical protein
MISAMQLLERQGEEVPQKAIDTVAMLETVRDWKTGEVIIGEAEKVTVSLVKLAEDPAGEAGGGEISCPPQGGHE